MSQKWTDLNKAISVLLDVKSTSTGNEKQAIVKTVSILRERMRAIKEKQATEVEPLKRTEHASWCELVVGMWGHCDCGLDDV